MWEAVLIIYINIVVLCAIEMLFTVVTFIGGESCCAIIWKLAVDGRRRESVWWLAGKVIRITDIVLSRKFPKVTLSPLCPFNLLQVQN